MHLCTLDWTQEALQLQEEPVPEAVLRLLRCPAPLLQLLLRGLHEHCGP